jgi:hypothetical protein
VPARSLAQARPVHGHETRIARGAFASPVLEDIDKDGTLDIIQAAFDGKVYVFDHGGGADVLPAEAGWPVHCTTRHARRGRRVQPHPVTTPAVADFNDDGVPDLVVGSNERLGAGRNAGAFYVLDGRGTNAPGPVLPGTGPCR